VGILLGETAQNRKFRGAGERDPARPLSVRQRCQEQWNEAILSPRQAEVRVPGDEEDKMTVTALMDQRSSRWALDRQPTKDERSGGEADILGRRLSAHPDTLDRLGFSEPTSTDGCRQASPA
jgi:hypothetical protein